MPKIFTIERESCERDALGVKIWRKSFINGGAILVCRTVYFTGRDWFTVIYLFGRGTAALKDHAVEKLNRSTVGLYISDEFGAMLL